MSRKYLIAFFVGTILGLFIAVFTPNVGVVDGWGVPHIGDEPLSTSGKIWLLQTQALLLAGLKKAGDNFGYLIVLPALVSCLLYWLHNLSKSNWIIWCINCSILTTLVGDLFFSALSGVWYGMGDTWHSSSLILKIIACFFYTSSFFITSFANFKAPIFFLIVSTLLLSVKGFERLEKKKSLGKSTHN